MRHNIQSDWDDQVGTWSLAVISGDGTQRYVTYQAKIRKGEVKALAEKLRGQPLGALLEQGFKLQHKTLRCGTCGTVNPADPCKCGNSANDYPGYKETWIDE